MTNISGALAPGKSAADNNTRADSQGERDLMLAALRAASARVRLIGNELDLIGSSLRQRAVDCKGALEWAAEVGLLEWIRLGPEARS